MVLVRSSYFGTISLLENFFSGYNTTCHLIISDYCLSNFKYRTLKAALDLRALSFISRGF